MTCEFCEAGQHGLCLTWVYTGRTVPDRDPTRTRGQMVPEFVRCACETCRGAA